MMQDDTAFLMCRLLLRWSTTRKLTFIYLELEQQMTTEPSYE